MPLHQLLSSFDRENFKREGGGSSSRLLKGGRGYALLNTKNKKNKQPFCFLFKILKIETTIATKKNKN